MYTHTLLVGIYFNNMAKDPAFLFYSQDFLVGTMTMNDEQTGKYIKLLCIQHQKGGLSEKDIIKLCDGRDDDIFSKFKKNGDGLYYNVRLREETEKRKSYTESRRQSRMKADEDNVRIYLLKDLDSNYIKIGSSVNPLRRYNEISNQTNSVKGASKERNYKLLWYSEPIKRKLETELHNQFKDKNISGEWYNLDKNNIELLKQYIIKTYDGTYDIRTENENENENENINDNISEDDIINNNIAEQFLKFWDMYGKKKDKVKCEKKFKLLKQSEIDKIFLTLPYYINSTPDITYRKNPLTYLNGKCWEDEIEIKEKKYVRNDPC